MNAVRCCGGMPIRCLLLLFVSASCLACGRDAAPARPNVLWIVWDTARADRLGLYGHAKPTTPNLERWARDARVYDDCVSPSSWTVPSHASMFTGLLPSEHGAGFERLWLDDQHTTVAELLQQAGYQTFLWAANPHIAQSENFTQGFDVVQHPWDPDQRPRALDIVRRKLEGDRSSELGGAIQQAKVNDWAIKASGELAQSQLESWLAARDRERPFFAFVNYMEAHRPLIPDRPHREAVMDAERVERSYRVDRSWVAVWSYTFGLASYTDEELDVVSGTYDAAIRELDDHLGELLGSLEARGELANTVLILVSDHGELLGEHHMLDHQYSLHRPLLHVPLVIRYPAQVPAGRDASPVMTQDLFPTVLALAGIDAPARPHAQSLLAPTPGRARLSEYPSAFRDAFPAVRRSHPTWDPKPWKRSLRALQDGSMKLIWAEDGRHELYDLGNDPSEQNDLALRRPDDVARMIGRIDSIAFAPATSPAGPAASIPEDQLRRLEALGYAEPRDDAAERVTP